MARGWVAQVLYKIKSVGSAEAINLINRESAVVVDVCEPKEYEQGHVPNSINIPLGSLASRVNELDKYKDKPVVVACRSGNRSMRGAIALRKNGFESVYSLSGGILAWQKGNLPVEKLSKGRVLGTITGLAQYIARVPVPVGTFIGVRLQAFIDNGPGFVDASLHYESIDFGIVVTRCDCLIDETDLH